jgi:hypothetical protein
VGRDGARQKRGYAFRTTMPQKRFGKTTLALLLVLSAGGCSSVRNFYAGIYDGLRVRQQQETLPGERSSLHAPMTYPQYEAERERLLKKQRDN